MKKLSNISLNINDIPESSALDIDNIQLYKGVPPYSYYSYFGDCKNTVDKDKMWDASQMGQWIYNYCKVIDINMVLDKIQDGDRHIPISLKKSIQKLNTKNQLNDLNEIVCALDDYQKIMFIYVLSLDTHFFFDCKK